MTRALVAAGLRAALMDRFYAETSLAALQCWDAFEAWRHLHRARRRQARLLLLVLVLSPACAARMHPVQPTPASWQPPAALKHCHIGESITWPDRSTTVTLTCQPEGKYLVNRATGAIVEHVTWAEIRSGR